MPERSLKLRVLLFLYSNANIAGCALALLGPALLFFGVIKSGWLFITAGLYGVGWLLGRSPPELERSIEDSLTLEQTLERLNRVIEQARPYLNSAMQKSLDSVRTSVSEVLPRLVGARSHNDDLFTVRETVLRYLPETLANYAAMPPAFRKTHTLKVGKTAEQLLGEQLALLDSKMLEVVANVSSSDAEALIVNGNFLEAKFRQPDFLAA